LKTIGYFDKFLHPRVRLTVKGSRKSLHINPVVDTGFDGDLCLPVKIAIQLGLELFGQSLVELADGSKKDELTFQGSVFWRDQERLARIFLTDSEDALISSGLFQGQKLTIGYANRSVTIEPDTVPKSGSRRKQKSKK
jgi:predicted aspartyl protease